MPVERPAESMELELCSIVARKKGHTQPKMERRGRRENEAVQEKKWRWEGRESGRERKEGLSFKYQEARGWAQLFFFSGAQQNFA